MPLFEGLTMPSSNVDSETAAMYKQLLLRPLAVPDVDEPEDLRLIQAFAPLCSAPADASVPRGHLGASAFTRSWRAFADSQEQPAREGRRRFLARYEWPSV